MKNTIEPHVSLFPIPEQLVEKMEEPKIETRETNEETKIETTIDQLVEKIAKNETMIDQLVEEIANIQIEPVDQIIKKTELSKNEIFMLKIMDMMEKYGETITVWPQFKPFVKEPGFYSVENKIKQQMLRRGKTCFRVFSIFCEKLSDISPENWQEPMKFSPDLLEKQKIDTKMRKELKKERKKNSFTIEPVNTVGIDPNLIVDPEHFVIDIFTKHFFTSKFYIEPILDMNTLYRSIDGFRFTTDPEIVDNPKEDIKDMILILQTARDALLVVQFEKQRIEKQEKKKNMKKKNKDPKRQPAFMGPDLVSERKKSNKFEVLAKEEE